MAAVTIAAGSAAEQEFKTYHLAMLAAGDCDPSYSMLRYVAQRFELNEEQRYWLAFLYAMTYCGPTVFYIYNEFPDYENVDMGRLQRWWSANKHRTLFQTDRLWIKSRNQFCEAFESYRRHIGPRGQEAHFRRYLCGKGTASYAALHEDFARVKHFGQFSLFLFLEAAEVMMEMGIEPPRLDLAASESSRNGLCWALGRTDLCVGKHSGAEPRRGTRAEVDALNLHLLRLQSELRAEAPQHRHTMWQLETTLCAFKKYKKGQRYVGYYVERQRQEIEKMQALVREGVAWAVLWQYRSETFDGAWLKEAVGGA